MRALSHRTCRGNSLIELVLLVPLYTLIIAGALLLGELALVKIQSHEANEYAVFEPGDQSESCGLRQAGPMKVAFWRRYLGELDLRENSEGRVPNAEEVRDLLEEMTEEQYSAQAHGRFVFSGGRLHFRIDVGQNRWRSWEGQYVLNNRLLEENVPEFIHETMVGYMGRRSVRTSFDFMPEYVTWSRFGLEGADVRTEHQIAGRQGEERMREVDHSFGAPHAPVEQLGSRFGDGSMCDYPQFMDSQEFWVPN